MNTFASAMWFDNIYAFEFDSERLGRLVQGLDFVFPRINRELQAFAQFLERLVDE